MKKKILIVEDEADLSKTIRGFLELEGFIALEAKDGEEALEQWRSEKPDLILLDIVLPGVWGIDVALTIANESSSGGPKIIVMSGKVGGGRVHIRGERKGQENRTFFKKTF